MNSKNTINLARPPAGMYPKNICSACKAPCGYGKGYRTGVEFTNMIVTINQPLMPQIHNERLWGSTIICVKCLEMSLESAQKQ